MKNMKLIGLLLTSALVTACGETAKSTNTNTTTGSTPPVIPAAIPAAPQPSAPAVGGGATKEPMESMVHVMDPIGASLFAAGDDDRTSLLDPKNTHPMDALITAEILAKQLPKNEVVVHTLDDLFKDPTHHHDGRNPVLYDVLGRKDKSNKVYLDGKMHVAGFAGEHADIEMRKGADFYTTACLLEGNSVLTIDTGSNVQVGSLHVKSGSKVGGEGVLLVEPLADYAHNDEFFGLNHGREDFNWATKGGLVIVDGSMESLNLTKDVHLTSKAHGSVRNLSLGGGIINLKASTSIEVENLSGSGGATFKFGWDTLKPTLRDGVLNVVSPFSAEEGSVKVNLTELASDIADGSSIYIVKHKEKPSNDIFKMNELFGANVGLSSDDTGVKLTLFSRGLNAPLKGMGRQFAQDALNSPMGSKFAVMDAHTTASSFEGATAESTLNNRVSFNANFTDLHAKLSEAKKGVIASSTETASKVTQSTGYAFNNGFVLAFSATEDAEKDSEEKKKDDGKVDLLGLHFGKGGFFMDAFAKNTSSKKASFGFDVSYNLKGFDLGVNYNHGTNSHETNSVIGNVSIPSFHYDKASMYVGFSHSVKQLDAKPIKFASKVGVDVYSSIAAHTASLNGVAFNMSAYSPVKSVTAELDAELPFALGSFLISYGVRSNEDFTGQFGALRFKIEM